MSKVYVVDNARDIAVKELCGRYPVVEYMANDNVGYGAGHNVALRKSIEAGVRYHLVLNSDVEFLPESVEIAVRYMEQNENVAASAHCRFNRCVTIHEPHASHAVECICPAFHAVIYLTIVR